MYMPRDEIGAVIWWFNVLAQDEPRTQRMNNMAGQRKQDSHRTQVLAVQLESITLGVVDTGWAQAICSDINEKMQEDSD